MKKVILLNLMIVLLNIGILLLGLFLANQLQIASKIFYAAFVAMIVLVNGIWLFRRNMHRFLVNLSVFLMEMLFALLMFFLIRWCLPATEKAIGEAMVSLFVILHFLLAWR